MSPAAVIKQFPEITFKSAARFVWSPKKQVVYYDHKRLSSPEGAMALLHEVGHARLGHQNFEYDIDLINMEVEAWDEARGLANQLSVPLDEDHIESCLETYRIWIYKRARCPECSNAAIQQTTSTYRCFNCGSSWKVAQTRTIQPRRMSCITPY